MKHRSFRTLAVGTAGAVLVALSVLTTPAAAHHVLGRPSYSLNEDSNTPPAMQTEVEVGEFFVTTMVFPAFPKPGEPGRINLYAARLDDGKPFQGEVTFTVRDGSLSSWAFGGHEDTLGTQPVDDNVFRQGFLFSDEGNYIITAVFDSCGESYAIDLPLRVGAPPSIGPLGGAVAIALFVLVIISVIQRRRAMTGKVRIVREADDLAP